MFMRMLGLIDLRQREQAFIRMLAAKSKVLVGAVFIATALLSIGYEEVLAPGMSRVAHVYDAVADVVGRKLSSLTF